MRSVAVYRCVQDFQSIYVIVVVVGVYAIKLLTNRENEPARGGTNGLYKLAELLLLKRSLFFKYSSSFFLNPHSC